MRKLIALILLTITFGGVAFAYDDPANEGTILGTRGGQQGTAVRDYKLVRFASTSQAASVQTISVGEVVVYDTVSDDGITIRRTTTSGDGAIAGVVVTAIQSSDASSGTSAQDDAGRRNWGYIQVHGPCSVNVITGGGDGGISAGDVLITSRDSGMAATLTTTDKTGGAGSYVGIRGRGGFFLDAPAAGTGTVFVELE